MTQIRQIMHSIAFILLLLPLNVQAIKILDIQRDISFQSYWAPAGFNPKYEADTKSGPSLGLFADSVKSSIGSASSWAEASQNTEVFLTKDFFKIRGTGKARARNRDWPANKPGSYSEFLAISKASVKFQLDTETNYSLDSEFILTNKWFDPPHNALPSLDLKILLQDSLGNIIFEKSLDQINLVNKNYPGSSPDPYLGFFKDILSEEGMLNSGTYEFSVYSKAFAQISTSGDIQLKDGEGLFDFNFSVGIDEPPTLALLLFILLPIYQQIRRRKLLA